LVGLVFFFFFYFWFGSISWIQDSIYQVNYYETNILSSANGGNFTRIELYRSLMIVECYNCTCPINDYPHKDKYPIQSTSHQYFTEYNIIGCYNSLYYFDKNSEFVIIFTDCKYDDSQFTAWDVNNNEIGAPIWPYSKCICKNSNTYFVGDQDEKYGFLPYEKKTKREIESL